MSIRDYFLRPSENMPRRKNVVTETTGESSGEANEATGGLASEKVCDSERMDPALQEVIRAVTENLTKVFEDKLRDQLDPISRFMHDYREQLQEHEKRITEAESRISTLEDETAPVVNKLKSLERQVKELTDHIDDMENRGRRRNIRIIGLPESAEYAEGNDPALFFEKWLPKVLNIQTETGKLKVDRAHRTGGPVPAAGQRPRPVLVRLHNYRDKERIMRASLEKGKNGQPLEHDGASVMIFQDFSAAVAQKRKSFDGVKKRLKTVDASYRLLYPAKLKVTHRGTTRVYQNPAEVERFLDMLK